MSETPLPRSVIAAFLTAALALIGAARLEIAFQWDLSTAVHQYAVAHPQDLYSAFCGYAYRTSDNNGIGNPWLLFGTSAALLLGGITCISLALLRWSRGSGRRRLAIAAGATEVGLSLVVLGLNYAWLTASTLNCLD